MKAKVLSSAVILVLGLFGVGTQALHGQMFELHPYAGGYWPGEWEDDVEFKNEGIYGVKGGVFITEEVLIEGNVGYMNHFEFEETDPESRAWAWGVNLAYNFRPVDFPTLTPYVTVGVGGITTVVDDFERSDFFTLVAGRREGLTNEQLLVDVLDGRTDVVGAIIADDEIQNVFRTVTLEDGDTFFDFSYGGGVKGERLWGPVGLRADLRGRTMPNFFGSSMTWLEGTGGLLFSWGER